MKKIVLLTVIVGCSIAAAAQQIVYGNNVTISKPVYEDMYVAGGTITINAPIHGDLVIAGGTIILNDTVTNDILLIGGEVTFNGFAGDDLRCAGGNLRISKNVAGDVVITGGTVIIDKGVSIGGLLASGGKMTVDGIVNGVVKGAFGELYLNGTILKDVDCRGGKITMNGTVNGKSILAAPTITIGNDAVFNNDVRYWNKKGSLDFKQSLKNSTASYDPSLRIRTGQWYYLGAATILGLLWWLGMALLMIVLVQYLFSAPMKKAADTFFNNSLKSLGVGFLYFIAVPVLAVIAFVTVIGVPVGFLLVVGYMILLLLASVITSVLLANWLNNRNNYNWNYWRMVFAALGIFILLKLLSLVPFAGWLIMLFLVCTTFGSILLNVSWRKKTAIVVR